MGALGGLYRPTPQGYIGNLPGVGPGCQCLWSPASPLAAGARRLVGPAGCLVLGRQAAPAACGSGLLLSTVAMLVMMHALSGEVWLQYRRLAGDHCSHSPSLLVNGAQTLRGRGGRLLEGGPLPLPPGGASPPSGARRQVGPAACGPYRQPVVGAWPSLPWVMSWAAWQQCRAGRGMSAQYAALWPRSALDSGVAGCTVATPRPVVFMWVLTSRARGAAC